MNKEIKKLGKIIVAEIIKSKADPREVALLLVGLAKDIMFHWNNEV